ncbi:hypothetical protein Tco_0992866 [Tanacetum coccineum]|uniref:Uncharacterized protein n=1 Tax=Tanacetum coccineum TaxID=301880 RepID=A0ABQ5F3L5_9ASTR
MASESTSSQQSQQLIPSSKVNFRCTGSITGFNNAVALLEHSNESFRPMLSFLSNCCINRAITLQPFAIYMEYLKEFWYTTEVEKDTKTITFLLSWWDKPLSFTQDEFVSAIGLPICKDAVPLPPKETIDIGRIIFSDLVNKLQNGKKNRELNICYTRFLSLMFENLLGKDYVSNDLTIVKPHTITTASFQKPLASEVPLTSHMLKVAKLSEESEQSLLPPSGEVNADDTADKSLSRASVQPVTQSKATTDLKTKKKRIPPSSKPKSPYKVRVILPKKQVAETQHADVANATKSLASESADEKGNQPSTVEAKKVLDQNIDEEKDDEFVNMKKVDEETSKETPTVEQLLDEVDKQNKDVQETLKRFNTKDSDDTQENDVSKSDTILQDDHASAERLSLPDHMDHICEEVTSLHTRIGDMESYIVQQVSADFNSSMPLLKDSIKSSISTSIAEDLPHVEAQVQKNLQDQLSNLLLKPMYKEFNAFNKLESQIFILLQKELSKSIHKDMKQSIRLKVKKGMKEVRDKLSWCTSTVATNSQHVRDLRVMIKDIVSLLEAAKVFKKDNAKGEKWEKNNHVDETDAPHPDQTKGEQILGANIADIIQGEQPPTQEGLNDAKALVVHNLEEKKEGNVSREDDSDDDDL